MIGKDQSLHKHVESAVGPTESDGSRPVTREKTFPVKSYLTPTSTHKEPQMELFPGRERDVNAAAKLVQVISCLPGMILTLVSRCC